MRRIFHYLTGRQPDAVEAALRAFECFDRYAEDPQQYTWATRMVPESCESKVIDLLCALRGDPPLPEDDPEAELDAVQNAEVVAGAERYYRTMVRADGESWNGERRATGFRR